jgi:adenylosuccinate lyase
MRSDEVMPFGTRYGSEAMAAIWSEHYKRLMWRKQWLAMAKQDHMAGAITDEELEDIDLHCPDVDLLASEKEEGIAHHDVFAELAVYASQCEIGGKKLHLGATSSDIVDNVDVIRIKESLVVLEQKLKGLLCDLGDFVLDHAYVLCEGKTHLQFAKYTTVGYRFARHLQNLYLDWVELQCINSRMQAKGWTGAIGTDIDRGFRTQFAIPTFTITTQVYPRSQDYRLISSLAGLAGSLHNMALDVRLMQGDEVARERFDDGQVGSSAMAHKRNPIKAENICGLARFVASQVQVAWHTFADNMLERTLDDSSARRVMLPSVFLAVDEMLIKAIPLIRTLGITPIKLNNMNVAKHNVEKVVYACVMAGANRQRVQRVLSQRFYELVQEAQDNDTATDEYLNRYLDPKRISGILLGGISVGEFKIIVSRCQDIVSEVSWLTKR